MRGLGTQENEKFKRFFALVQAEASKQDKIYFLETGDGNLYEDEETECEDLQGWLIDLEEADEFEQHWKSDDIPDKWSDNFTFALWSKEDDKITIEFKVFN